MKQTVISFLILVIACTSSFASEKGKANQPVAALAKLLIRAQKDYARGEWQKVADDLSEYRGKDHPMRWLMIGHAEVQLRNNDKAVHAYGRALKLDADYRPAGIGLIQIYARAQEWKKVMPLAGRFINVESDGMEEVLLYAQAAYRLGDFRLAGHITRKGMVRFPVEKRFRTLDLSLLLQEQDGINAEQAAVSLLLDEPENVNLWRQFGYAARLQDKDDESLVAIEAAWLCGPKDAKSYRKYLSSQIAAGHFQHVLAHGDSLLKGDKAVYIADGYSVAKLMVRAADASIDDKRAHAWLGRISQKVFDKELHLCAARLALREGDYRRAYKSFDLLIKSGCGDANVYLWAGHMAEKNSEFAAAEANYVQAKSMSGRAARMAWLHLARLLWTQQRQKDALNMLSAYLEKYPADTVARALHVQFSQEDTITLSTGK